MQQKIFLRKILERDDFTAKNPSRDRPPGFCGKAHRVLGAWIFRRKIPGSAGRNTASGTKFRTALFSLPPG
jgi:hypothetical protein